MVFGIPKGLDFDRDGVAWPHREHSRFVKAFGSQWHVQEFMAPDKARDSSPVLVLLHGTGASTHSWRALMPLLAKDHRVIAFDFPGQGFSQVLDDADPTLKTMAAAVAALMKELNVENPIFIGHSAGAAVALQVALSQTISCGGVVSVNGALYPFPGAASTIFPALAKMLFVNPFTPHVFAFGAGGKHRVRRLLDGTGSELDDEGLAYYQQLFQNAGHVRATLAWMANWNLAPLARKMGDYKGPFLQIIGGEDQTIEPGNAFETSQRLPQAETKMLRGRGHLVHEEEAETVADLILAFAKTKCGVEPRR